MTIIMGVDPGISGAVAFYFPRAEAALIALYGAEVLMKVAA
jgi:hypothetical protein